MVAMLVSHERTFSLCRTRGGCLGAVSYERGVQVEAGRWDHVAGVLPGSVINAHFL